MFVLILTVVRDFMTAVVFEFDSVNYTVTEEGGAQQVCVNQVSGQSSQEITVSVQSVAGTATGTVS